MRAIRLFSASWLAIGLLMASCAYRTPPQPATNATAPIVVSAAASTKEVVEALAAEFSRSNGVEVKVNAGPSNALASQILAVRRPTCFSRRMRNGPTRSRMAGWPPTRRGCLTNQLVIVVPKGNPAQVHEPKDLLSDAVKKIGAGRRAGARGHVRRSGSHEAGVLEAACQ